MNVFTPKPISNRRNLVVNLVVVSLVILTGVIPTQPSRLEVPIIHTM